ncbi:MAG: RNA polymerase sigma factor [Lachnospiraceae bacterium]|nr:RNA polymerase sigma factor [Lachnospiraceae bacterium]
MLVFVAVAYGKTEKEYKTDIDETLFYKIGQGDKDAFMMLYEQTKSMVFSYALSVLHNREDAEDAMQETYLKIRAAAHLYKPQGKPMAWVFTITRNICLMKYRMQQRQSFMELSELDKKMDFHQIEDREDRIVLETAFSILSKEECQIIMLHVVSGLKHREISQLLKMPVSTILSKYHRGIKKLRKNLEGRL